MVWSKKSLLFYKYFEEKFVFYENHCQINICIVIRPLPSTTTSNVQKEIQLSEGHTLRIPFHQVSPTLVLVSDIGKMILAEENVVRRRDHGCCADKTARSKKLLKAIAAEQDHS